MQWDRQLPCCHHHSTFYIFSLLASLAERISPRTPLSTLTPPPPHGNTCFVCLFVCFYNEFIFISRTCRKRPVNDLMSSVVPHDLAKYWSWYWLRLHISVIQGVCTFQRPLHNVQDGRLTWGLIRKTWRNFDPRDQWLRLQETLVWSLRVGCQPPSLGVHSSSIVD